MRLASLITPSDLPQQWAATVDAERVPGAVLLTGPDGAELLPLALALVAYLQCTNRQDGDGGARDSCGTCEACRQNAALGNPDVQYSFPVVGTGVTSGDAMTKWREEVLANPYLTHADWLQAQTNDNKQGNINRQEVMRILHHLSLARFTSGFKVVVVWGADYLMEESNRLLKAIEEPPADTLILLVTTRAERILPTISSRCRVLRLPLPPTDLLADALVARSGGTGQGGPPLSRADAADIAYNAGGHLGQAFAEAARRAEGGSAGPDLAGWLRSCFAGKGAPIVKAATQLAALTREQQKAFLQRALRFVRELGVARAGEPRPLQLNAAEAEVARKLAALADWPQLTALARELEDLLVAVERNANGKIAFAASSIRIHYILARPTEAPATGGGLRPVLAAPTAAPQAA